MHAGTWARVALWIVAATAATGFPRSATAAADGVGRSVMVPWVKITPSVSTEVVVVNHGVDDVDLKVDLHFPGAPGGSVTCTPPPAATPLPAHHQAGIDVTRDCRGLGAGGIVVDGALHIRASVPSGSRPARIAAVARWLVNGRSGRREQELDIPSLPLSALPGLDVVQRVDAIAYDDVSTLPTQTDCQFAAGPADNRAVRKVDVRLQQGGMPLGAPFTVALAPNDVENVPNVFARAGVGSGAFSGVQLVVDASGQPDLGIAVLCNVAMQRRSGAFTSPALTLHAGLPLDGATLVRRHRVVVEEARPGVPLVVRGTENALHHVFLRHQDRLSCSVRPTDPQTAADSLRIAAVPPDRSRTIGGGGTDIVLEDTGTRADVARGLGGAWALLVEQANPDPALGIAYRLDCSAGNGVSPPLRVAISPTRLPRP